MKMSKLDFIWTMSRNPRAAWLKLNCADSFGAASKATGSMFGGASLN
jgi:hypothetical protein